MTRWYRALVLGATCLAFVVVVVGAYVRLMDAGLGCPDWPGCYGAISPEHAAEEIARAVASQGGEHGPVSLRKAWKEMFHRYLAGTLGLAILAIAVLAWRNRRTHARHLLPCALLALVIVQAALGMWTVTLLLKPVIVTLHLLGGMATLAALAWLALRELEWPRAFDQTYRRRVGPWAAAGLAIVAVQIALGGWVSSNYAALACIDFPKCHGAWLPNMDFVHGFQLVRELGRTAAGTHLAYEALVAVHWTHRIGALVTVLYAGSLALVLMRMRGLAPMGAALAVLIAGQVALGIANILAGLPLAVAVAHNAVAACLLVTLVMINFAVTR
ncbi:MAG TPA: COX15/CtaA family protein [Burkholderiales bacterium]|nr:COX15/CtaA family protein [Burkholderiales bacterium]